MMPIYEFECRTCFASFEKIVSIGAKSSVACPKCLATDIRKLISSFGIGGGTSRIRSSSENCDSCTSSSCSNCR